MKRTSNWLGTVHSVPSNVTVVETVNVARFWQANAIRFARRVALQESGRRDKTDKQLCFHSFSKFELSCFIQFPAPLAPEIFGNF